MTPNKLPPLPDLIEKALKRAFRLGQTYWQQADSQYTSDHKRADVTMEKFKALTGETLESAEALRQSQSLPADEPVAWWNGARESKLDVLLLPSVSWTGENTHHDIPLFAGCNPHSEIVRKAAAYDALQSLPAGAVAWAIELSDGSIGALGWSDMRLYESAQNVGTLADGARYVFAYREQALQADAREKGEVASGKVNGYLFSQRAIEVIVDDEIPEWMSRQPGIRVTITPEGATQPAQASEKDSG